MPRICLRTLINLQPPLDVFLLLLLLLLLLSVLLLLPPLPEERVKLRMLPPKEWLIEWCTFGDQNAFRNHKPFVGNTNAMEPWISGPYHTLWGLECTGNGRVPED